MFFIDGSIAACVAYIDGFAFGRGGNALVEIGSFRRWLAIHAYESHGLPQNLDWSSYIIHEGNDRFFAELPVLFDQFLADQKEQE